LASATTTGSVTRTDQGRCTTAADDEITEGRTGQACWVKCPIRIEDVVDVPVNLIDDDRISAFRIRRVVESISLVVPHRTEAQHLCVVIDVPWASTKRITHNVDDRASGLQIRIVC
jgi:hypothetical protein